MEKHGAFSLWSLIICGFLKSQFDLQVSVHILYHFLQPNKKPLSSVKSINLNNSKAFPSSNFLGKCYSVSLSAYSVYNAM